MHFGFPKNDIRLKNASFLIRCERKTERHFECSRALDMQRVGSKHALRDSFSQKKDG